MYTEITPNVDGMKEVSVENMKDNVDEEAINRKRRILTSFWIFGLTNDVSFVVFLTAANDILGEYAGHESNKTTSSTTTWISSTGPFPTMVLTSTTGPLGDATNYLYCNPVGTGVILIANIAPSCVVKLIYPFFMDMTSYNFKVFLTGLFCTASFLIVAFAHQMWLSLLGVVCASLGGGIGENVFLALATLYGKNAVSSWSSGTGSAGLVATAGYAGLISAGLSPRHTLLTMISVPTLMLLTYTFLLVEKSTNSPLNEDGTAYIDEGNETVTVLEQAETNKDFLTLRDKILLLPSLFKYMFSIGAVLCLGYFINHGIVELLYFNDQFLSPEEQYRWYQTAYHIGVFITRSSVNLFVVRQLWILPILQFTNVIFLMFQIFYRFIPSLWIILAITFWEGLIGGASYVNTFYLMSIALPDDVKEYSVNMVTLVGSAGIFIAGVAAEPTHNRICSLKLKM